jgi:hypothetical protein
MMVGNNLKDTQLQQIVDKTIIYADKDNDGKISFVSELFFIQKAIMASKIVRGSKCCNCFKIKFPFLIDLFKILRRNSVRYVF